MESYLGSKTWKRVFEGHDDQKQLMERLRTAYAKMRDNAAWIASEINTKMPNFTVHTVEHMDALWDMIDIFEIGRAHV